MGRAGSFCQKIGPLAALLLLPILLLPLVSGCAKEEQQPVSVPASVEQQIFRGEQVVAELKFLWQEYYNIGDEVYGALRRVFEEKLARQLEKGEQALAEAEFNGTLNLTGDKPYYYYGETVSFVFTDHQVVSMGSFGIEQLQGEAHPMDTAYGYTFDAEEGRLLTLEDLFGEGAQERVAEEIYRQIEQEGQRGDYFSGLRENLLLHINDHSWYRDNEKLYVIYNPYQIAPFAKGVIIFELPFAQIAGK